MSRKKNGTGGQLQSQVPDPAGPEQAGRAGPGWGGRAGMGVGARAGGGAGGRTCCYIKMCVGKG